MQSSARSFCCILPGIPVPVHGLSTLSAPCHFHHLLLKAQDNRYHLGVPECVAASPVLKGQLVIPSGPLLQSVESDGGGDADTERDQLTTHFDQLDCNEDDLGFAEHDCNKDDVGFTLLSCRSSSS